MNIRNFLRDNATASAETTFRVKQGADTTSFKMAGPAKSATPEGLCQLADEQLGLTKVQCQTKIDENRATSLRDEVGAVHLKSIILGRDLIAEQREAEAEQTAGPVNRVAEHEANGNGKKAKKPAAV